MVDLELVENASENFQVGIVMGTAWVKSESMSMQRTTRHAVRSESFALQASIRNSGDMFREAEVHFVVKPANPHVLDKLATQKPGDERWHVDSDRKAQHPSVL